MCRILGYLGCQKIGEDKIKNAIQKQILGGPDSQSFIQKSQWALANNRLAIQGLLGGQQPFKLKKTTAVYNGEIYNHKELKKELIQKSYTVDDCDGSVILPLYDLYGESFFQYLDGMFAIAIIDETSETKLMLAVDHSGIKSLFYTFDHQNDMIYFASEICALSEFPIKKNIREEAFNEYLIGRSMWHDKTFFEDIKVMEPRGLVTKSLGKSVVVSSYNLRTSPPQVSSDIGNIKDASRHLSDLLRDEIEKMLLTDVPVCLVTSGGLDSSLLTAIAAQNLSNIECFNIAYEGNWPSDERKFAKEIADKYSARYNQILIKEDDFLRILDLTVKHLGQPNSAPHSLSTYALFEAIHSAGYKVAVTGEGADETFGGYTRFRKACYNEAKEWDQQYFDEMCATTQEMRDLVYSKEYKTFIASYPSKLDLAKKTIKTDADFQKSRLKSILDFDQKKRFPSYILRRVDHLSMANSVEVRVPFCQSKIMEFAAMLPDDFLLDQNSVKKVLYQVAKPLLPVSIINRPKQPFTLPIVAMLRKGHMLFDALFDTLNSQEFKNRGIFDQNTVTSLIAKQEKSPSSENANMLWSIMMLEKWLQRQ